MIDYFREVFKLNADHLPLQGEHEGVWHPPNFIGIPPHILLHGVPEGSIELLREINEKLGTMEAMSKVSADAPLSLDEAAAYLGVHYDTAYKWAIEEGLIGWYDIGSGNKKKPRFYKRDLDAFVRTYRVEPVQ